MFSASDDGRPSDAIAHGNRLQPPVLPRGGTLTDIDLRLLPTGTQLSVDTRNSQYRLFMLDGSGRARVQGGRYFCEEADARIEGATFDGGALRVGWICLGLRLEFSLLGKRIVTSNVRAINVEPYGS